MRPAKKILEKEYDIVLSDKMAYYKSASVEYLNKTGRLADLRNMGRILFALCDIIDKQQEELEKLKNDTKSTRPNTTPVL